MNKPEKYWFEPGDKFRGHLDEKTGATVGLHKESERCVLCDEEDALPKVPPTEVTAVDEETGTITLDHLVPRQAGKTLTVAKIIDEHVRRIAEQGAEPPRVMHIHPKSYELLQKMFGPKPRTTLSRRVRRNRDR